MPPRGGGGRAVCRLLYGLERRRQAVAAANAV